MIENEQIIQIIETAVYGLVGLSSKGKLYAWNRNINDWSIIGE